MDRLSITATKNVSMKIVEGERGKEVRRKRTLPRIMMYLHRIDEAVAAEIMFAPGTLGREADKWGSSVTVAACLTAWLFLVVWWEVD